MLPGVRWLRQRLPQQPPYSMPPILHLSGAAAPGRLGSAMDSRQQEEYEGS